MTGNVVRMRGDFDTVQLKLRFSERLRVQIAEAAQNHHRSLNGEIISRLEQSFLDERISNIEQTIERIEASVKRLEEIQNDVASGIE